MVYHFSRAAIEQSHRHEYVYESVHLREYVIDNCSKIQKNKITHF